MTDLEFLKNASSWPHWPFLPMKKDFGTYAVVAQDAGGLYIIARDTNLFSDFKEAHFERITPEAIIAEGWIVD